MSEVLRESLTEFNAGKFSQLVNAEEFFDFFELSYDSQFVNVNRLHILQKFSSLIKTIEVEFMNLNAFEKFEHYRAALQQAYDTFTTSSPLDEKLFKVFNDKPQNVVLLSEIGTD